MKKTFIIGGMFIISLLLAGAGCADRPLSPTDKPVISIGVVQPLTGPRADAGEYTKNALAIAEEEINNDPTKTYRLKFIFEDSKYEPQAAVTALNKLKDFDRVRYVIGGQGSSEALAMAPIAEENKIIMIVPYAQTDAISQAGDYIFRVIHNTAQEAPLFADFVASNMKGDTLHFITMNTDITPSYLKHFQPAFEANAKKIGTVEKFETKDTDMRTQLLKIKSKNPTDIFIIATPKLAGIILKQGVELGIGANWYNIGTEGPELTMQAGSAAEGLLYPYSYDRQSQESRVANFVKTYRDKYGKDNDAVAVNVYDAARLFSNCFERVGDDVEKVKSCLYETKDYHGAGGTFSFDSNGDAVKPLIVKTVKDGKFVKFGELQ